MGKRRSGDTLQTVPKARLGGVDARHVRTSWSLPIFSFLVTICFVLVPIIDPSAAFAMTVERVTAPAQNNEPLQTLTAGGSAALAPVRTQFTTSKIYASAPAAASFDAGTAQAIAYDLVIARGWDDAQFNCLVALWNRESHWNVNAHNPTSGAHGIPQALPGEKMASVADDWETNPETQIIWGLGYIEGRYTNPCGAWTSSETRGWY